MTGCPDYPTLNHVFTPATFFSASAASGFTGRKTLCSVAGQRF
jgi:hypothetical protein